MILTVLNVFAGVASLVGFFYTWSSVRAPRKDSVARSPLDIRFLKWTSRVFVFTGLFALYVLFYPGSLLERNVRSKTTNYRSTALGDSGQVIQIQRGSIRFAGDERAIEFDAPFADTPSVDIVNTKGYRLGIEVGEVTPHSVTVTRSIFNGFERFKSYRWIARGPALVRVDDIR